MGPASPRFWPRREEVALLAGISVDYYTRLERGNARGVSESVLEAISQTLQLDEAEHAHLLDLVRTANAERPPRRTSAPQHVRPSVARIVDAMTRIPACVLNGRLDILYANDLANALFSDLLRDPVRPPNLARFAFLDPRSRALWVDWEQAAWDTVAILRAEAGRNPYDRALSDLVLSLVFEPLELPADPGLSLLTYTAEPGSASEQALDELARWGATRARLSAVDAETQV
jgi:transcriptional regulator with XRE-family HTH domain